MKINKIKRSFFLSLLIVFVFRLLFFFIPIYSSVATIVIPKSLESDEIKFDQYSGKEKCLSIKVNFDKLNNQTILNLNSRSLKKEKGIKCIEDSTNFIKSLIDQYNSKVDSLLFKSEIINKKIDDLINDLNSNKRIDKDKLILINDYFFNITNLGKYKKIPSPLTSFETNTYPIRNSSLFRYLFSGFILFFWIFYVLFNDFKKQNHD